MTDEEIINIFKQKGMRIELGAQFSAYGQIAALLDAAKEISKESYIRGSNDCHKSLYLQTK